VFLAYFRAKISKGSAYLVISWHKKYAKPSPPPRPSQEYPRPWVVAYFRSRNFYVIFVRIVLVVVIAPFAGALLLLPPFIFVVSSSSEAPPAPPPCLKL
jgi:hypothetical protein